MHPCRVQPDHGHSSSELIPGKKLLLGSNCNDGKLSAAMDLLHTVGMDSHPFTAFLQARNGRLKAAASHGDAKDAMNVLTPFMPVLF